MRGEGRGGTLLILLDGIEGVRIRDKGLLLKVFLSGRGYRVLPHHIISTAVPEAGL